MVRTLISTAEVFFRDLIGYVPPGVFPATAVAFIENGKYTSQWWAEFAGTLLMVVGTFSAGKWIGTDSEAVAWVSHAAGVVASDYLNGGQHVNPAVTMSMWALGHCTYTDAYVRVSAQMAGGLVAFPIFHAISDAFGMTPFGGPEFNPEDYEHAMEAFIDEFLATLCLLWVVYIVNWELHFGRFHYLIKQTLTAVAIRVLILAFPVAGPAMNPMLATTWAVWGGNYLSSYQFPSHFLHYFVYWFSPCLAALFASVLYVIFAGGKIFGRTIPIGPIKAKAPKVKDN